MLLKLNMVEISKVVEETNSYLEQVLDLKKRLDENYRAMREICSLIPQTLDKFCSGHFFPLMQAKEELQNSAVLAYMGFYQYAFAGLRWVLELGMLSVYWDRDDLSEFNIREWYSSCQDTPFKRDISAGLKSVPNIARFMEQSTFLNIFDFVYGELSNYNHVKGVRYSSLHLSKGNIISFKKETFRAWAEMLFSVVRLVVAIHLLKYPVGLQDTPIEQKYGLNGPVGGFLNPWQADQMRALFNEKDRNILQEISDDDEEACILAAAINELPDISEEELEKQMLDFDKYVIENKGF